MRGKYQTRNFLPTLRIFVFNHSTGARPAFRGFPPVADCCPSPSRFSVLKIAFFAPEPRDLSSVITSVIRLLIAQAVLLPLLNNSI